MASYYYVNKNAQNKGEHEVHVSGCSHLPDEKNQQPLGLHPSCSSAVREAKKHFAHVDGCYYCCRACNNG